MERYDDQSDNNLWKLAAAPADLPGRPSERARHRLLPGVRDPFLCVSISGSRRAAASGPHASSAGIPSGPAISATLRSAAPATVGRAHRLILLVNKLLVESRASPPGRLIPQGRARPSLHYFCAVLGLCSCPQLKRRPMMHFTIK